MSIPLKDQKILWGRGASICSKCKNKVSHNAANASGATLTGENCHIVGENAGAARSNSHMSIDDRNKYHNLILLCNVCHKIVDDDESTYTIEELHKIKSDHELWVEERLLNSDSSRINSIYLDLIEFVTENLMLRSMDILTDHCLRGMLYTKLSEGIDSFGERVFRIIWPKELIDFESAIINLENRCTAYNKHFHTMSRLDGEWFKEDKSWKRTLHPQEVYSVHAEKSIEWQNNGIKLLFNMVKALNEYCESVRIHIKQDYFISYGKFVVRDDLGVTNEMVPVSYIPDVYRDE